MATSTRQWSYDQSTAAAVQAFDSLEFADLSSAIGSVLFPDPIILGSALLVRRGSCYLIPAPDRAGGRAIVPCSPSSTRKTGATRLRRPDGLMVGSKQAILLDLALRPEGASQEEMWSACGWGRCHVASNLRKICDRVGAEVEAVPVADTRTKRYYAKYVDETDLDIDGTRRMA